MATKTYRRKCKQCTGSGKIITKEVILKGEVRVETTTLSCSKCSGKGFEKLTKAQIRARKRLEDASKKAKEERAGKRLAKQMQKEAMTKEWMDSVADRRYIIDNLHVLGRFGAGLKHHFYRFGVLSPKQEEAARKGIDLANSVKLPTIPTGRHYIIGTVHKMRRDERLHTQSMLIATDEKYMMWGTIPKDIRGTVKVGDRVELWANTFPNEKFPNTGVYRRPTKASIL